MCVFGQAIIIFFFSFFNIIFPNLFISWLFFLCVCVRQGCWRDESVFRSPKIVFRSSDCGFKFYFICYYFIYCLCIFHLLFLKMFVNQRACGLCIHWGDWLGCGEGEHHRGGHGHFLVAVKGKSIEWHVANRKKNCFWDAWIPLLYIPLARGEVWDRVVLLFFEKIWCSFFLFPLCFSFFGLWVK